MERTDFGGVVATLAREMAGSDRPWPTIDAVQHLSQTYDITPGEAVQLVESAATLLRLEQAIATCFPAQHTGGLHYLSGDAIPEEQRSQLGYHLTQDGQTGSATLLLATPSGRLVQVSISARCCGHA